MPQFFGGEAINKDSVFVSVFIFVLALPPPPPGGFVSFTLQFLRNPPLLPPIARCLNPKPFFSLDQCVSLDFLGGGRVGGETKISLLCPSSLYPSEVLQQTLLAPLFFRNFCRNLPWGGLALAASASEWQGKKTPGGIFLIVTVPGKRWLLEAACVRKIIQGEKKVSVLVSFPFFSIPRHFCFATVSGMY